MSKDDPFFPLSSIRETGDYSSRNASKGAMLPEFYCLITGLRKNYSKVFAKELIFVSNILNKNTYENRRAIWNRLNHRYFKINSDWILSRFEKTAAFGIDSNDFISLSYLYYALRDRITHDFVNLTVWVKWNSGLTNIDPGDFIGFLNSIQEKAPELKSLRETTRNKMASITLSALRDFGLLGGTAIKHIKRPTISSETVYHLLAILWAEGKRGRALLEAEDWKLFLWNDTDTTNALVRLSQLGWIKFERGGQTVILEMIRMPEMAWENAHGI
jgi:Putative inner membrane protein (DUF1819)